MFEIMKGFDEASNRRQRLQDAGFAREAFVYSAICLETVCYRILRARAQDLGYRRDLFEEVFAYGGIMEIRKKWKFFCPSQNSLNDAINSDKQSPRLWKEVDRLIQARNSIFHGSASFSNEELLHHSTIAWSAINVLRTYCQEHAIHDPFSKAKRWPNNDKA